MPLTELDYNILRAAASFVLGVAGMVTYFRNYTHNSSSSSSSTRRWLSVSQGKRWGEIFFLKYSAFWISCFAIVIVTEMWRQFEPWHYLALGVLVAFPGALAPLYFEEQSVLSSTTLDGATPLLSPPSSSSSSSSVSFVMIPFWSRYWVKANVWIAIFSFIGNYFWTHYFYTLLRAYYTMPAHRINFVPICMILYTHAYFITYHTVTTAVLRRWWTSMSYQKAPVWLKPLGTSALVFVLSYITAFAEAFTIQNFEYYHIEDREFMYTVGCMIYGVYFIVSFPMFYRLDEETEGGGGREGKTKYTLSSSSTVGSIATGSGANNVSLSTVTTDTNTTSTTTKGRRAGSKTPTTTSTSSSSTPPPDKRRKHSGGTKILQLQDVSYAVQYSFNCWSVAQSAIDSLAAGMLVTILLEIWRLGYQAMRGTAVEGLLPFPTSNISIPACEGGKAALPWMQ